jgi:predicted ATPase
LHPELLPALGRLIIQASENTQIWIVTHSERLVEQLTGCPECHSIKLEKNLGQTFIAGQGLLDAPAWHWPDKA